MANFRTVQEYRDASTILVGVGGLLLLLSFSTGLVGFLFGFPFGLSWMSYWLGPIFGVPGLLLFLPGLVVHKASKRVELD